MVDQETKSEFQWFVIHTLSGQEQKVKENIERRIKVDEMGDLIQEVLIPTEKVAEVKKGKKTTSTRKFYPGYILVHIKLLNEKNQLVERSWYFVRDTPGIIGFIGGDRPVPLKPDEVNSILAQIEERQERVTPKIAFETIRLISSPIWYAAVQTSTETLNTASLGLPSSIAWLILRFGIAPPQPAPTRS